MFTSLHGVVRMGGTLGQRDEDKISRKVEKLAVEIVQSWVDAEGEVKDLGLGGGPDFEIKYNDGRTGIGEVGLHEDPEFAEAWALIHKSDTPQQITLPDGSGYWAVGYERIPNMKRLRSELPSLIAALNDESLRVLDIYGEYPQGKNADWARDLGINYLNRHDQSGADVATFFLPFTGGAVPTEPDLIVDWFEGVLASEEYKDSWMKLLPFDSDEKHVFIMTSNRTPFGIDELLKRNAIPVRSPNLPGNLTHIWIASRFVGVSAIHWSAGSGWQQHDL